MRPRPAQVDADLVTGLAGARVHTEGVIRGPFVDDDTRRPEPVFVGPGRVEERVVKRGFTTQMNIADEMPELVWVSGLAFHEVQPWGRFFP